ncbi:MAG: phosphoribosylamine--glycine ligase [Bdellovibrionales bacterium GWB1_52_6]|nr:MAG: phosphoribosylamine--glycine ligase [Bdellovibrionales bacterium GWB1_52_6]OFZ04138.1 MAG: phosphoribosylamine--glycine ligase [Bdellovibrionales bacterium GWA1_52_35]HCM40478.1 phosphoribosylamine--glycine ligase [Bdellovibrionales bacterium]
MSGTRKVLIVGSGGREHALAWKLSLSPQVGSVIVAPGNDGWPVAWSRWAEANFAEMAAMKALARRAREAQVDLAVIGPDDPLANGIVDAFNAEGIACFGPTRAAAQLEASKAFAKEVMRAAGVPTAEAFVANSLEEAEAALVRFGKRDVVVKADGLALGKGVRVCFSPEEARQASQELFAISGRLLIEEKLQGEEISWMAFCDGEKCALLEPARDHKQLKDGNLGPNTGGMGAFSPVPGIPEHWYERMRSEVFHPVLKEMKRRGTPFRGLLYAGLMVDLQHDQFWVLEFNARFGDPEAQVLLPRMDEDFYEWCLASAQGQFPSAVRVRFKSDSAVVVVAAARGYPEKPQAGVSVSGKPGQSHEQSSGVPEIFWAGVTRQGQELVTSGGRVFGAMGMGPTLEQARAQAYERLSSRSFEQMVFRKDIALAQTGGGR